ncbi:hypothetical protein KUCAC02_000497 [Chaenocephalus aceratus]|uniref:Uncharacterized protein n=1 Tax=Chaenocephalus aceratus TaxID=36190 RepID=A0ACB9W776_CHAAC|nr:hypothetical protein KUCAC02_000497 [Chaenocephalus aceratus]
MLKWRIVLALLTFWMKKYWRDNPLRNTWRSSTPSAPGRKRDEENWGNLEYSSFLGYLDELYSDEQRFGEAEFKPDTEFLDYFLSSDPEFVDLLALEKQEIRKVILEKLWYRRHDRSIPTTVGTVNSEDDGNKRSSAYPSPPRTFTLSRQLFISGVLDELCCDEKFVREVEFTLDTKFLDSLSSSDPDPIDLLALEKQKVDNRNGEYTRQRNVEPKGDLTTCSPLIPSHLLEETLSTDYPVSATSALNHNGCLFMNFPSLQLHCHVFPRDESCV